MRIILFVIMLNLFIPVHAQDKVYIEANTFTISGKDKRVHAQGAIEFLQKDIKVVGDNAEYAQDKKEITIWNNVKMTYKKMLINCNKLMIDSANQIVYAEGNIQYVYEDIKGRSDRAVFYSREEKVDLIGNTEVTQGDDFVKGTEILVYMANKKIMTVGRTKIRLSPEKINP